jgi:hypothetical protein
MLVCDNILLNKPKTMFGEEKKLNKQKLINPREEAHNIFQIITCQ